MEASTTVISMTPLDSIAFVETKKKGITPLHIRLCCSPQPPRSLGGDAIQPVCQ